MITLLVYFLKKDIKSRYIGSGLGIIWAFVLPLFQVLLFWFVFAGIFKARPYANTQMPYLYFFLSSFFFWLAFSEGLTRSMSAILENGELVKKVSFPNIVLPLSATLSSYLHHLVGFLIFLVIYMLDTSFNPYLPLVLPVLAFQVLFSIGLGLLFTSLLPYVRDIAQIMGYVLQGLFFLSPIMYSMESIPEKFRPLIALNPYTSFAQSYQSIILLRNPPELYHIGVMCTLAILALAGGTYTYNKLKEGFADVL